MLVVDAKVKLINGGKCPEFKRSGDACADCYANCEADEITIRQGERCVIPLGFAMEIPEGYEIQLRPRSGMSKLGIDIAFGTGEFTYRGEYGACFINNSKGDYVVHKGDRICQLAIRQVPPVSFKVVDELSETERGINGWGSSGK